MKKNENKKIMKNMKNEKNEKIKKTERKLKNEKKRNNDKNEKVKKMRRRKKKRKKNNWKNEKKEEKHENKNEKMKKNEEIWLHTQNPRRFPGFTVVVVSFFVEILDDFHEFVSENVFFDEKQQPVLVPPTIIVFLQQFTIQQQHSTTAGPFDVPVGSVASQFLTLVGELAGEARCQPGPCTSDTGQNYYTSGAAGSHVSNAVSSRPCASSSSTRRRCSPRG